MRRASERHTTDTTGEASELARCVTDVAVGASQTATIDDAVHFCMGLICDFLLLPVAHARLFAKRITSVGIPSNIWLFRPSVQLETRRAAQAEGRRRYERWYSQLIKIRSPFICEDVDAQRDFPWKQMAQTLGIKSTLVVPILFQNRVTGALDFFSRKPMSLGKLPLEIMRIMGGRVGYIIEQKRAERNIQSLSKTIFHLVHDERRRLSHELHDTTAQNLAAIVMNLGVIEQNVQVLDSEACHALSNCFSLARQSLREVRTLSYLLHPPMVDQLGLVSALRAYLAGFSQRSGMRVDFSAPDYVKLPADLEVTLFHIVQEGLTNAHRHSDSPWAKIRMTADGDEVRISVENKTTAAVKRKAGVGLRSMQERVQHLGGSLIFHSDKHRTVLAASLPVRRLFKVRKANEG